MARSVTFATVQKMASEAGLTMSRDFGSLDIRLRYRDRPKGPRWVVPTVAEALEIIDRQVRRLERRQSDAA
ncbi:MAG: hypothetical protein IR159_09595 [Brevundimonas sp.]|nr:hypothetical protein [Brevundimonas sp.]